MLTSPTCGFCEIYFKFSTPLLKLIASFDYLSSVAFPDGIFGRSSAQIVGESFFFRPLHRRILARQICLQLTAFRPVPLSCKVSAVFQYFEPGREDFILLLHNFSERLFAVIFFASFSCNNSCVLGMPGQSCSAFIKCVSSEVSFNYYPFA